MASSPSRDAAGPDRADVVIAGGGLAGLTLAIALKQALGRAFSVVVCDPALGLSEPRADARASAIAAAARRLFAAIGVWPRLQAEAQPILDMAITDSRLDDRVRPVFLTFAGEVEADEPFAHMVENTRLTAALRAQADADGVTLIAERITGHAVTPAGLDVELGNAKMRTRLLVAADGVHSRIRERCRIGTVGWTYPQCAIATTVAHERDHGARAIEHFLPAGPFAILPLKGRRSSIVWTEETAEAERIVALRDAAFTGELERRFGYALGDIEPVGPRHMHPLGFSLARRFVAPRVALVGDAAHLIHPIAGQGLNMGLRDVAALAEAVVDAARLGLDPGSVVTLERYERWRRFDSAAMGATTDVLNRLFSNRSDLLKAVRDFGLSAVDRLPALKSLFIREAAGLVGDVPKLLRGEAL
jgi:2-octaprenyl-6-methoxyphenol hydroxylase